MTPLVQTDIYKKWLIATEHNRSEIFESFDNLWANYGNNLYEIGENIKIFHAGQILSFENFDDKPIFCSENKTEAESYLNFDGPGQRSLSTFSTVRACKFAYLGGSFIENGFADILWAKGIRADPLRAISAREWAADKSIDGWYRDIGRGELLMFRPLQTLRLTSKETAS